MFAPGGPFDLVLEGGCDSHGRVNPSDGVKDATAAGAVGRAAEHLPDLAAFAAGLGLAWYLGWRVRDLVWSLWLSSLLVGYAIIVWKIFGPAVTGLLRPSAAGETLGSRAALAGARMFGGLFMLAFFTVHFGMFHVIHSVFLNHFFPAVDNAPRGFPKMAVYLHVLRAYWPFVIVAAVAERSAFRLRQGFGANGGFAEPYSNVLRMHLLIFFFAFAHFLKLENMVVYAVVYAFYFFPWPSLGARAGARRGAASLPGR
jgi:hypothetical protein